MKFMDWVFDPADNEDLSATQREEHKLIRGALKLGFIFLVTIFFFMWSCAIIPG